MEVTDMNVDRIISLSISLTTLGTVLAFLTVSL
jgi:hypothetical protein